MGDRVLNIISSRQVKNNQSLIDLLFNQEQKKNCFYDKNKNAEKSENLLSVIQISGERISFYEQNKKNTNTLLNSINFYDGALNADGGTSINGYFSFGSDGRGQVIPKSAIPRINVSSLSALYATGNKLRLSSNNYYAYKALDGKSYACAFNGKVISRAFSEAILGDDKTNVKTECRGNTALTMSIISSLSQGSVGGLEIFERSSVKEKLGNIGIESGEFQIEVDGKEKTYYLGEDGSVYTKERADEIVNMYNSNTWLKGRNVGDKILVFGKEYEIDNTGHINVPTEGYWNNEKCNYGTWT